MYERFTDEACKTMQLANQEALNFNHECIRPEHMLLGLVEEGGAATDVLRNLGVDLETIRPEVEKRVRPGLKKVTKSILPHSAQNKKVLEYSLAEARRCGNHHVGTEHLLLGLLRQQDSVAHDVLLNLLARLDGVRDHLRNRLPSPRLSPLAFRAGKWVARVAVATADLFRRSRVIRDVR